MLKTIITNIDPTIGKAGYLQMIQVCFSVHISAIFLTFCLLLDRWFISLSRSPKSKLLEGKDSILVIQISTCYVIVIAISNTIGSLAEQLGQTPGQTSSFQTSFSNLTTWMSLNKLFKHSLLWFLLCKMQMIKKQQHHLSCKVYMS